VRRILRTCRDYGRIAGRFQPAGGSRPVSLTGGRELVYDPPVLMSTAAFSVDLHVHSRGSGDTLADPEECVLRGIERGLHVIAFTEHYSFEASEPIEPLQERYRDRILILRGVEFSAEEGHCLVFGVDTDRLVTPYAPAAELVWEVNRAGGVVIPSHPYRGGSGLGDLVLSLPGIAALEGHNGCNGQVFNRRAIAAARQRGIPCTGGSDAHLPGEVGSCFTLFSERVTAENLVGLLKAGRYDAVDTRKTSRG
jgi:predicted metal-dependent phosphoesterase TrpH